MPIKNYTTKISVERTLGEIHGNLAKHGARKVMFDYDDTGKIAAVCFSVVTPNGECGYRLPANVDATHRVLHEQGVKCDREQAARLHGRCIRRTVITGTHRCTSTRSGLCGGCFTVLIG